MGAIKIGTTTVISSSRAATFTNISGTTITGTSIDVSGNSDANTFRINGTAVVNSSRNLTGLGSSSGALALSGRTLTLTIGGTSQDTQDLGTAFAVKKLAVYASSTTGTISVDLTNSTSALIDYYGATYAGCGFSRWARCDSNGAHNINGSCWRGVNLGEGATFSDSVFCSSGGDYGFNTYVTAALRGSTFHFKVKFTNANTMTWNLINSGPTSSITVMTF